MERQARRGGWIEMTGAMAMSGTIGYFVVESGQSIWNVVFFRCLFGALGLLAYCGWRGLLVPWRFTRRTFGLALVGGVAIVLNWVLLFSAYGLTSISIATAVYNMQPFFLILLGIVLFGERPTGDAWGFIAIAFAGLLMVVRLDLSGFSLTGGYLAGLGLALGAAALYAVTSIVAKRLQEVPPHLIALVQAVLGTAMLAPFADFSALPAQPRQWGYLVVLGLGHTCLMYILLYSAIQKLPTARVAVLSFVYPAVAILVDYLAYGRELSLAQWTGIALILLGSAGVNLKWRLGLTRPLRPLAAGD
ncbi:DMT family transporter [Microvirga thermotolerans]|uniref:EamA family transporter n=1 Tax=Microvirga thermotolerans TaxID=2651334 RepID=A0A5P9JSG2_9HYPH|nr:EamA family transporter [Microvirga thermotolerans]QFU15029.1 EamA family transporter [Microvirga thermotolerans]